MAEINRIAKDADERQAVVVYTYPWSRYLGPGIGLAGILFVSGIAAIFVDSWGAAVTLAFLMIIALVINIPRIVAELKAPRILEIKDGELTAKWLGRSR